MMPITKQFQHLKILLEAIKTATNDFADDNCIGKGGFGKVYKGELLHHKGRTIVAIKRLDRRFGQGNPEFWKEIILLSLYKHENIVSLLGFCDESDEKILVYEYASKGSLDLYLNNNDLTWIRRLRICIGAARGLAYLHNPGKTQQRVLHRDIKSSNILLEENWNVRISDFGLSKFGPANQQYTFLVSNTVGTIGYCDPLYVETGLLTKESDVYSFGVVLFEILCGRLSVGGNKDKRRPLTGLVRQHYKENRINEIIFGNIKDEINPASLEMFTTIAYQCLEKDRDQRPLMTEVVSVLENAFRYQEQQLSASQTGCSSLSCSKQVMVVDQERVPDKHQTYVKEDFLIGIYNDFFPSTAEQFFNLLMSTHGSNFISSYHSARMDRDLQIGQWAPVYGYDGQLREIAFTSHQHAFLFENRMINKKPVTKVKQYALLSSDKKSLVIETVEHTEDIPFGSFGCDHQVHSRWIMETTSVSSCIIEVKVGVSFNRWYAQQSSLTTCAIAKYKEDLKLMLEVARSCLSSKPVG